jgi:hypothetical protein
MLGRDPSRQSMERRTKVYSRTRRPPSGPGCQYPYSASGDTDGESLFDVHEGTVKIRLRPELDGHSSRQTASATRSNEASHVSFRSESSRGQGDHEPNRWSPTAKFHFRIPCPVAHLPHLPHSIPKSTAGTRRPGRRIVAPAIARTKAVQRRSNFGSPNEVMLWGFAAKVYGDKPIVEKGRQCSCCGAWPERNGSVEVRRAGITGLAPWGGVQVCEANNGPPPTRPA